jgi:[acyl-carrier-protein] S-malonyltransferase
MGAKRALPLSVSAPFHCELMRPAADALRGRLESVAIAPPRIPVVNNIDVAAVSEPAAIRDALVRQAYGPVRWVEVVQALRGRGLTHVLECGPGKVLTGMVKRIDGEATAASVSDPASLREAMELLA